MPNTWVGMPRKVTAPFAPSPPDFRLPPGCSYVGGGIQDGSVTRWRVDCGRARNRDGRGTLGAALDAQGWPSRGIGLATATWVRGPQTLIVTESSGSPGDFIEVIALIDP